ncbi:MAG: hypothetical protein U1D36_09475 [Hydrogenophaga sp.]|uniref:hypothetical protein n=1 Tax=Hydrogenophaga sp. TaxID=1904254 RepID=UPI002ABA0F7C|nr:hypothetical protein [Hydrogenophaga sp.]MDZ4174687.1 hypothetical protein [Hydrogenophaga sp.]
MAQALRLTLIRRLAPLGPPGRGRPASLVWLAALPVALILGPLLPGLYWALAPSLDAAVWQALWADAQWPQALQATLLSALLGTALGVAITAVLATLYYPGRRWADLQRRMPLLLSVPHAAFAVGLFFLLSPSGWLARAGPGAGVGRAARLDHGAGPLWPEPGAGAGHQGKLVPVVGAGRGAG